MNRTHVPARFRPTLLQDDLSPDDSRPERPPWRPGASEIVRLALQCRLETPLAAALLVKRRFERLVAARVKPRTARELAAALEDPSLVEECRSQWTVRPEAIRRELTKNGYPLPADRRSFAASVRRIVQCGLFLGAVRECGALRALAFDGAREAAALESATEAESESYHDLMRSWVKERDSFDLQLMAEEGARAMNDEVRRRFLGVFGDLYEAVVAAECRLEDARERLEILRDDPALDSQGLPARLAKSRQAREERLRAIRWEIRFASIPESPLSWLEPPSGVDEIAWTAREYRRLLGRIWLVTHPDKVDGRYTEAQREELRRIYLEVEEIRAADARIGRRSLAALSAALDRVLRLVELAGLDVDPEEVILGETIGERAAFLTREVARFRAGIEASLVRLHALVTDPETLLQRQMLASPDRHPAYQERFRADAARCEEEIGRVEEEIRGILELRRRAAS